MFVTITDESTIGFPFDKTESKSQYNGIDPGISRGEKYQNQHLTEKKKNILLLKKACMERELKEIVT